MLRACSPKRAVPAPASTQRRKLALLVCFIFLLGFVPHRTSPRGLSVASSPRLSWTKSNLPKGLTHALSVELGPLRIRTNAIVPGYIETNMLACKEHILALFLIRKLGFRNPSKPMFLIRTVLIYKLQQCRENPSKSESHLGGWVDLMR